MTMLSSCWTKAALLGSLWAAVEIVLGSFLHNIGMPLTGTVLSALGVCLMVAGGQLWPDRGIIWRAGVLCALMKSVSPSAVIIGPMIGITLEAFLLDGMTRLLGRTAPGYILGGALATTLPVFQKLIGLVFTYGLDAARLYVVLYEFAARSLHLTGVGPLDLILLWLGSNLLLGTAAAVLGMRAGKHARELPDPPSITGTDQTTYSLGSPDPGQRFSLPLFAVHVLLVPLGFIAIRDLQLYFSAPAIIAYAVCTLARYARIRRRLTKPRPWIEFTLMALLAGFFLGELAAGPDGGPWTGVRIGLQMALRAVLVVVAFSAISVELRNPMVVRWFLRRGLSPVSAALDIAFQALPAMMHAIGEERKFLRHPMVSIARVLAAARAWLGTSTPESIVILITGPQGSGKTSFLLALAAALRIQGKTPGGIAAPVMFEGSERIGYDLLDLETDERVALARKNVLPTGISTGPFTFLPAAIAFGELALASAAARKTHVIALDEIGPLELAGKGWSPALSALLLSPPGVLLLVVRPDLIQRVLERWNLKPAHVWKPGEVTPGEAARQIIATLSYAMPQ
jgi:nucleoside-triphosphatase THEP1